MSNKMKHLGAGAMIGLSLTIGTLFSIAFSSYARDRKIPLEVIDPSAKYYKIRVIGDDTYHNVKDPVIGIRGQLTFKVGVKEVVLSPAVQWIGVEE